jgi:hypothetical protein
MTFAQTDATATAVVPGDAAMVFDPRLETLWQRLMP